MGRGLRLLVVLGAATFALAPAASARAPLSQLRDLRAGTAIVQTTNKAAVVRMARGQGLRARRFKALPFVSVRGRALDLRRLGRAKSVRAIHMDRRLAYHLHESVPITYGGVDPAPTWTAGFDGRGVNVAVVDTGVNGTHPDLEKRVVRNFKVLGGETVECPSPCNSDITGGHGTHVAGIVAGDGTASDGWYRGVAPGAGIVGFSAGEVIAMTDAIGSFDYILANNKDLKVSVVNNSWGPEAGTRFDATDPVNVGTKALHDAGVTVVFSAGNSGTGGRTDKGHEGASDCGTEVVNGERVANDGECTMNANSVAPWVISTANTRKEYGPKPGDQSLNYASSRGDPVPEVSLDGSTTLDYIPTIAAPGTNIWSARDHTGASNLINCGSADPVACQPPADRPDDVIYYLPLSGTSMAAPHVAGAVAVLQSYAAAKFGRKLSPDEVKQVLQASAAPMTKPDMLWDWPCGSLGIFVACGETKAADQTGLPYQRWQVGAGAMDITAAMAAVRRKPPRVR